MVEGPTDTTTVGLSLHLCHLNYPPFTPFFCLSLDFSFSSSSKMKEKTAALVGFYPAFSSLSLFLSIFLYYSLYQTTLSTSLQFPPSPIHPSMPVFKVHLLPSLSPLRSLLHRLQSSLQQCHHKDLFTQGKKKPTRYQRCRVNALYFNIGRDFI